ncbi:Retrotrans gag domain-containing protein [Abeliophyllum distichum]|uniref:Retrotrans gag domain-containing protein n=1 Tax=Abeliophyllum distichum TaxID=126358 RepID=A0ABD1RZ68_9LAMI
MFNPQATQMPQPHFHPNGPQVCPHFMELVALRKGSSRPLPFIQQPPTLELKPLSLYMRYAYLVYHQLSGDHIKFIKPVEKGNLLRVLKDQRTTTEWSIVDIKSISPSLCLHKILI